MFVKYLLIICGLFIFMIVSSAEAVGIGAKPARLDFSGAVDESVKRQLLISNDGSQAALFVLSADDLVAWFVFSPEEFQLWPGETQTVSVKVMPQADGVHATFISALARPLDRQAFKAAAGLKIPVTITAAAGRPPFNRLFFYSLAGLIIIFLGLIFRQRRQRKSFSRIKEKVKSFNLLPLYRKPWYIRFIRKIISKL